jgi:hypothetical protein
LGSRGLYRNPKDQDESPRNDNFHGIGRLVSAMDLVAQEFDALIMPTTKIVAADGGRLF